MSVRRSHEELTVITKTYDLILWSCHHTGKFPRNHRFVLGERIERTLYDLLAPARAVFAGCTWQRGSACSSKGCLCRVYLARISSGLSVSALIEVGSDHRLAAPAACGEGGGVRGDHSNTESPERLFPSSRVKGRRSFSST
jgi:hypothetical protein